MSMLLILNGTISNHKYGVIVLGSARSCESRAGTEFSGGLQEPWRINRGINEPEEERHHSWDTRKAGRV